MSKNIERALRESRPAKTSRYDSPPPEAYDLLRKIQASSDARHVAGRASHRPTSLRRRRRGALLKGSAAVVVLATVGFFAATHNAGVANAVVPPMLVISPLDNQDDASALLRNLSDVRLAESDADQDSATRMTYEWSLRTTIDENNEIVSSNVLPSVKEYRFLPDNTVLVSERVGEPFEGQQLQDLDPPGTLVYESDAAMPREDAGFVFLDPPPVEVEALKKYLADALSEEHLETDGYFEAVSALVREWVLSPEQEAAALRLLSEQPNIVASGATMDRLGRAGVVFTTVYAEQEYEQALIVSPSSGKLLAWENVYKGADRPDIPSPAVVSYMAWDQ